jgi:hypothetical protein
VAKRGHFIDTVCIFLGIFKAKRGCFIDTVCIFLGIFKTKRGCASFNPNVKKEKIATK